MQSAQAALLQQSHILHRTPPSIRGAALGLVSALQKPIYDAALWSLSLDHKCICLPGGDVAMEEGPAGPLTQH